MRSVCWRNKTSSATSATAISNRTARARQSLVSMFALDTLDALEELLDLYRRILRGHRVPLGGQQGRDIAPAEAPVDQEHHASVLGPADETACGLHHPGEARHQRSVA